MIRYFRLLTLALFFLGIGATGCSHFLKKQPTAYYQIKSSQNQARQVVVLLDSPGQRKLVIDLSERYALQFDVVMNPGAELEFNMEPIELLSNSLQCISPVVICKYRF